MTNSLTREEYLSFCKVCKKRAFNREKGIVCSLTDDHAAFEGDSCPDQEIDQAQVHHLERKAEVDRQIEEGEDFSFMGIEDPLTAGILASVVAIAWFIGGLAAGRIFFYPPVLLILGLIAVNKGVKHRAQEKRLRKFKEENSEILDL